MQQRSLALLLAVAVALASSRPGLAAPRREKQTGDLRLPCQGACPAASTNPRSAQAMPSGCAASAVADLPARWALPQYGAVSRNTPRYQGPHPRTYARVAASQVPAGCNPTAWAWERVLRAITDTIALDLNYCHHHTTEWMSPLSVRQKCDVNNADDATSTNVVASSASKCVCASGGMNKANAWRGLDCSNFSAWVYNLAFGFYFTSGIGEQACHPTLAPGRLLSSVTTSNLDQLAPGDLLFITPTSTGKSPPVRVSHVVMWTGWRMGPDGSSGPLSKAALLANVSDKQRAGIERCMAESAAAGRPVYIIADSHFNGPALRPFCGWYKSSFSHARRVIEPASSLPTNDASVASFSGSDCMSNWALRGGR